MLAWKNRLLKLRNWSVLLLELAIPCVVLLGIYGLTAALKATVVDESVPVVPKYAYSMSEMYSYAPCDGRNLLWACFVPDTKLCANGNGKMNGGWGQLTTPNKNICQRQMIAIAPSDGADTTTKTAATDFYNWVSAHPSFGGINRNVTFFKLYASESAFLSDVKNPLYSISTKIDLISAAIIFRSGKPSWDYTVRMNRTESKGKVILSPKLTLIIYFNKY